LSLDTILWLSGFTTEVVVVALCIKGRLFRITPVFCWYLVWGLFIDPVTFFSAAKFSSEQYFKIYVGQLIVDSIFQFAVLVELGWAVLRPIRSSLPKHSVIILAILITLAGAVIWPISAQLLPKNLQPSGSLLVHIQETFAVLRVVIFLALAGFSQLLSIGWRHRELQIATGLGFYSMFSLGISLIHGHQAVGHSYHLLDQLGVASYVCSLIYWIVSFAQQEEQRHEFTPQMRSFLLTVTGAARGTRVALANSGIGTPQKPGER
jgi:hypothetical protein